MTIVGYILALIRMEFTTKKGRTVTIRPVEKGDLDGLLAYINALIREDTFIMRSGKEITRDEEEKYLTDALEKIAKGEKVHIVALVDGVIIGSAEIRVQPYRKTHVGEIGISIAADYRDEGIGKLMLSWLVDKAKAMRLRLLYLHVFATNAAAVGLYEKLGFMRTGNLPGALAYKGEYIDELTMYLPLV